MSLKIVLKNNPKAIIVTNRSVGKLLEEQGIPFQILEDGQMEIFSGVKIQGCGEKHAVIYGSFGQVQNTGYFFAERFFTRVTHFIISA